MTKFIFECLVVTFLFNSCGGGESNGDSSITDGIDLGDGEAVVVVDFDRDGFKVEDGDCNDYNPQVYPGARELPDGMDNDCDGIIDEGTFLFDDDGDGFSELEGDCDDGNPAINPDAEDISDGLDNDCDGFVDGSVTDIFNDDDGDGFSEIAGDCNDSNPDIHPGIDESLNGIDDNCNGVIDEGTNSYDDDDDGFSENDGDCDDHNSHTYPGAQEIPDGIDNNCNGDIDEGTAIYDGDGDGYIYTIDCDDTNPEINPDAEEIPYDGIDQDCDGMDPVDLDGDGYAAIQAGGNDCNDGDFRIHPHSHEIEVPNDGVDVDCDGKDYCTDLNCDGYSDIVFSCHHNDSTYNINSFIYWGSSTGYSPANRLELPTNGALGNIVSDLNGDGYLDIVFSNHYNGSTGNISSFVYWGSSSGFSATARTELPTSWAHGVSIQDVNGDSFLDIIFSNHYNGSSYNTNSFIYRGSSSGYSPTNKINLTTFGATGNTSADLNSDGFVDIVFSNYYNGSTRQINSYIYWGSSSGYAVSSRLELPTIGAIGTKVDDLNGDGFLDIIFANYYTNSSYNTNSYIYWGSSSDYSSSSRTELPTSGAYYGICIFDANNDGFKDILFTNYYNGSSYNINSYIYLGSSSGYSSSSRIELPTIGAMDCDVADLNGDGFKDIVFANYYNGSTRNINSYIYWGSDSGYSQYNRSEIPTQGAINITIAGGI